MKKYFILVLLFVGLGLARQDSFLDGVLTRSGSQPSPDPAARIFVVVDSFASPFSTSIGLGCDGRYIWNDDAFSHSFARIDPVTHGVVTNFYPTNGNRDMAFDGAYLWASDWNTYSIYKYDTSNCAILATYDPGFPGHANGMTWDGNHLWVGEEDGRIYKMNTIGDTLRSLPSPAAYPSDPRGLAFAAGHLWVGHQGYGRIYEIDTITGAILNFYSAPGFVPGQRFQQGLDCDGQYLWSTCEGSVNMIYKIDIGLVNVDEHTQTTRDKIHLNVNPNPAVTSARITFALPEPSLVRLSIIDASGRIVSNIVDLQKLPAGEHRYNWTADQCPNGTYFAVLKVNNITRAVKAIKL